MPDKNPNPGTLRSPLTENHAGTAETAGLSLRMGIQCANSGMLAEAESWLQLAISLQPGHPAALTVLGDVLRRLGRIEEALPMLTAAVELAPGLHDAHLNLGIALCESDQLAEAVSALRAAIRLNPSQPRAHNNLGIVYKLQGHLDEALECLNEAVRLAPDFLAARSNRAMTLLLSGNFEEGWCEYEWRAREAKSPNRPLHEPLHAGMPLDGKTILLHSEQGLGDVIQFVRYAATLQEMGAHVIVECPERALSLIRTAPGVADVAPPGLPFPEFDFNAYLLSLPWILHPRSATKPVTVPYLSPDSQRVDAWRRRIGDERRLRVGLVWGGNPDTTYDRRRSMALQELAPILRDPAVKTYALQRGPRAEELAQLHGELCVVNLEEEDNDLMDTAAAMMSMDLLISVDTMPAHLAGALGRPVWLLLPFAPDWRWMTEREDSPWYPTMRLFRQPRPGDWESVMRQAAQALREANPNLLALRRVRAE